MMKGFNIRAKLFFGSGRQFYFTVCTVIKRDVQVFYTKFIVNRVASKIWFPTRVNLET